jgi:hypothetical protein
VVDGISGGSMGDLHAPRCICSVGCLERRLWGWCGFLWVVGYVSILRDIDEGGVAVAGFATRASIERLKVRGSCTQGPNTTYIVG